MLDHSTIKKHYPLSHSIHVLWVTYTKIATEVLGAYGHENRVRIIPCSFYPSPITRQPYHEFSLAWNACLFPLLRKTEPGRTDCSMWEAEGHGKRCTCCSWCCCWVIDSGQALLKRVEQTWGKVCWEGGPGKKPKAKGTVGISSARELWCCWASRQSVMAKTAAETFIKMTVLAFWTISPIITPLIYYNSLQLMDALQGN